MIYVAYLHDRHRDPVIRAFADREQAIDATRRWMADTVAHPSGITEESPEGFELWLRYEYESDHAFVVAVAVESPRHE